MATYLFTVTGWGPTGPDGERQELTGSGSVTAPTREQAEERIREDRRRGGHTIDRLRVYAA